MLTKEASTQVTLLQYSNLATSQSFHNDETKISYIH
jgi:hypothetical protein